MYAPLKERARDKSMGEYELRDKNRVESLTDGQPLAIHTYARTRTCVYTHIQAC